jgi:N6-L-threonylcarbamoyladenine synthase
VSAPTTILALETSCDETAAAVVVEGHLVLGEAVASQVDVHRKYGGVVPELASRNHVVDVVPVVQEALQRAGLTLPEVDAVAVTAGPGLVGALLVGVQFAKALAYAHRKPLLPVHHHAGHLSAIWLHRPGEPRPAGPAGRFVALAVSGGHTALYAVDSPTAIRCVANTRDDAAGEAFDKVARMLGLGYPGGPVVERLARRGDPRAHAFGVPRFKDSALDFSFSGLKTAVLTVLQRRSAPDQPRWAPPTLGDDPTLPEGQALYDLLASFQAAAIEQLTDRVLRACQREDVADVALVGGVACNGALRDRLARALAAEGRHLHVPPPRWCTDNAAMIAAAAWPLLCARHAVDPTLTHGAADRQLNAAGTWQLHRAADAAPIGL